MKNIFSKLHDFDIFMVESRHTGNKIIGVENFGRNLGGLPLKPS